MRLITQNIDGVELPEPVQLDIHTDEDLRIDVIRLSDGTKYDFWEEDMYHILFNESEESRRTPYASTILKEVFHLAP